MVSQKSIVSPPNRITSLQAECHAWTARQALVDRDMAQMVAKQNPSVDNTRLYKNMRNNANKIIISERKIRKRTLFEEESSTKQKWKRAKEETGHNNHSYSAYIKDGTKILTKPREIATSMNIQYISTIRETISSIPETDIDPLILYSNFMGPIESRLNFDQISMHQLTHNNQYYETLLQLSSRLNFCETSQRSRVSSQSPAPPPNKSDH